MDYVCKINEQQAQPVISIRTRTTVENLKMVLGSSYGAIMKYLGEIGEQPAGTPFVAYYNMDMQDLDIEVGFPVNKYLQGEGEIKQGEIPAARYASCLYIGPYHEMVPAYNALIKWISENGYEPTGVSYEYYLNDPGVTAENELQTRIDLQLR